MQLKVEHVCKQFALRGRAGTLDVLDDMNLERDRHPYEISGGHEIRCRFGEGQVMAQQLSPSGSGRRSGSL
jgi:hypothetical protein